MEQQREGVLAGDAEELDRRLVADEHELDEAVAREVAKTELVIVPPSSLKVSQTEKWTLLFLRLREFRKRQMVQRAEKQKPPTNGSLICLKKIVVWF